jgi:(p)ppGpp synthase/HD superfamily hydrolase
MELGLRFGQAVLWANELHRGQWRKGTDIPYVSHLMGVAALVIEHGGREDQAIAALLHDAIEDTDATYEQIGERFGSRVADIVRECSDADVAKGEQKPEWRDRKEKYLVHLESASPDALLVSLADKVHNARTLAEDVDREGDRAFARFNGKVDGTRWNYRRLADVYERRLAELPAEKVDGRSRAGGKGLLHEYLLAMQRIGATADAADAYEERNKA